MNDKEKYSKVIEWISQRDSSLNLSGLAGIANVPKHSLIKAVKYKIPLKKEYVDRLHECIERVFNQQLS